jgi:alpha-L-rhamnosidase
VLVASHPDLLSQDRGDLWDSGKVASEQSVQVEYAGEELKAGMFCCWKVQAWNRQGRPSCWSRPASWSMGLLKPADWKATWIGLDGKEEPVPQLLPTCRASWVWLEAGAATSAPAEPRYFRRIVTVPPGRQIKKATCQMTADDGFTLLVNGQETARGQGHNCVVNVDVTTTLHHGANTLAVRAYNSLGPPQNPAGLIGAIHVEFTEGDPLVIVTDAKWRASASGPAGWEKPEFNDSAWSAAAVLGSYGMGPWGQVCSDNEYRHLPARMLRHDFQLAKKVARATAYVCGLGFFELHLNGRKVGDHVMDPGLTRYDRCVLYLCFDVTEQLRKGTNAVGIILGNARFFAPRIRVPVPFAQFGYPKLLFQMEVEYADGSRACLVSDEQWRLTDRGPIRANNEYDGEEYDARLEQAGWDRPGFDAAAWQPAQRVAPPGGRLAAQMMEPTRITEVLHPLSIANPRPGMYLVDFGQNLYGAVRLKVVGPRGTAVRIRTAYSKKADGTLKMEDNRSARSTDVYVLKGQEQEVWQPRFRGQGTRHAEISGFPGVPKPENCEFLVMHTDMEQVGHFACSNRLLNNIYANVVRSMRMQNRSVPMEPDRDERMPWLGHPAKTSESEAYVFGVAPFYRNFLAETRNHQRPDGLLSDAGCYWSFYTGDIIWPSVITIVPHWYHQFYSDRRILEENYDAMRRWMECQSHNLLPDHTMKATPYGDWVDAYNASYRVPESGATSLPLMATAYFYRNCRIVEQVAGLLGNAEDQHRFQDRAEKTAAGFRRRFFCSQSNKYESKTQCSYVLPLAFGLVPEDRRAAVVANLVDDILALHHGHLTVGLIGMQWYMQALTDMGRPDVAFAVATQTTRPSWGYMLSKGATSIWERWDQDTRDPGMNGESQMILAGNLGAWFYQTLGGINYDSARPGFKHMILRPRPLGDLAWVTASHKCLYGTIRSAWRIENGIFHWKITVPPNTTATIYVPTSEAVSVTEDGQSAAHVAGVRFLRNEGNAVVYEIASGTYDFAARGFPVAQAPGA